MMADKEEERFWSEVGHREVMGTVKWQHCSFSNPSQSHAIIMFYFIQFYYTLFFVTMTCYVLLESILFFSNLPHLLSSYLLLGAQDAIR